MKRNPMHADESLPGADIILRVLAEQGGYAVRLQRWRDPAHI